MVKGSVSVPASLKLNEMNSGRQCFTELDMSNESFQLKTLPASYKH